MEKEGQGVEKRTFVHETLKEVEKDKDFDIDQRVEELRHKEEVLKGSDFLSDEDVENTVAELKDKGQSFPVMSEILERIQRETNYLHEWVENGFYEHMLNDDFDSNIEDVKIKWEGDKPKYKGKYGGHFVGFGGANLARVNREKPEPADIVRGLAIKGHLPKPIRIMGHERNHAYHSVSTLEDVLKKSFYDLQGKDRSSQELQEAMANRTANKPVHKKTREELSEKISPDLYPGVKEDKKECAIEAIDKLNALGLTPEEMGKIILHHGGWDSNTKTYVNVERKIKELQSKKQISDSRLEKLMEADKSEREVGRLRAMLIAQEEIGKWKARSIIEDVG
ncbi:MAG: hypothetical protein ABIH87_02275 [bacterium]